jgi:hypothetical protein
MLGAKSNLIGGLTALAVFSAAFAVGVPNGALAQEPPLGIPAGGPAGKDPNSIPLNSWLLYPAINFSAQNSNNFFISPQSKISGWQFGVTPSATAVWSNGIHTTTIYGNVQRNEYPTTNQLNGTNAEATFTQQYAPLRDLNFTVSGDWTHQTLSSALTNAIPSPIPFTGFTVLPNGNIILPNGTIVNPSGQVVGQIGTPTSVTPPSTVNSFDQYTALARMQKIFNYGIVTVGASAQRVNYVDAGSPDYTNKTFTQDSAFWLGPVFYFYSDGSFNMRTTEPASAPNANSTAYRIVGGIGTRQYGLFRASAYFGHQGSGTSGSPSSGGNVFGGALTYYPTQSWTLSANVDETINLAPAGAPASNQALGISGITPIQIATSSSTQTTSTTVRSSYILSPQWSTTEVFGFTHIDNIGSPIWDNSYIADAQLSYSMRQNLSISWEYQFSSIVSNAPNTNANRHLVTMSAAYKF